MKFDYFVSIIGVKWTFGMEAFPISLVFLLSSMYIGSINNIHNDCTDVSF